MTFAWPHLLWLILLPAAWLGREIGRRRRVVSSLFPHIDRAEAGAGGLTLAVGGEGAGPTGRPSLSASGARVRVCLFLGLALGIAALARPQWGRLEEPVFEQAREIVIAVDLSRSMLTPDVKPSRLERAKLLIQSLLDGLAGERVGLISFAGTAFLQAPLSADYEILREFLPSLGPGFMPVGGTDYAALIAAAADAFGTGQGADRYLIILSDGGATDEGWRQHVDRLRQKGVRVIGLGVGTSAGALIPDGAGGYVKDERGAVVMSKLESDSLRELSQLTGGVYRDASEWIDLPRLLKSTVETGRKGRFTEKNNVRYAERFQWALAPALLFLLISLYREFPVRPKVRALSLKNGGVQPALAALFAAGLLSAFGLARPLSAAPAAASPPVAPGVLLGRIVGRLSAQNSTGALDWLELGRETLSWAQQLQGSGQPVPAGPVKDAIDAVDAGRALDAKAADWPKLRSDLEALLKEREKQKSKPPPQQKNQQQQQQQKQQQSQSNSSSSNSSSSPQDQQQQQQQQDQSQSSQNQNGQGQGSSPPPQSAFGKMNPPSQNQSGQPASADDNSRKVGGARAARPDPANADPTLSPLMQKLEEVKNRDSPAQLFQMFERNEPRPPQKKDKDW